MKDANLPQAPHKKKGPKHPFSAPKLLIRLPYQTYLKLRNRLKIEGKGMTEWLAMAVEMRLETPPVPSKKTLQESLQKTSGLDLLELAAAAVRRPSWEEEWPKLRTMTPEAAMRRFRELRANREPAPPAGLVRMPEGEAVAWLTVFYPLS